MFEYRGILGSPVGRRARQGGACGARLRRRVQTGQQEGALVPDDRAAPGPILVCLGGVLDERHNPCGHEPCGSDRLARPGDLRDLDLASGGGYLHPPTGLGGDDLVALEAGAGVDHDFDPITFHEMEWYFSRPAGEFARTPCVAEFERQR